MLLGVGTFSAPTNLFNVDIINASIPPSEQQGSDKESLLKVIGSLIRELDRK